MERSYKERIKVLDQQARNVTAQEQHIKKLEAARRQALETVKSLEQDVQVLKAGKVTLQRQLSAAAKEQLAAGKAKDKELLLLKRQNARIAAEHAREQEMLARRIKVLEAENGRKQVQLKNHKRHLHSGNTNTNSNNNANSISNSGINSKNAVANGKDKLNRGINISTDSALQDSEFRREWVEAELEACYFSHELQRQLETEKSLRSQASRQLREVERRLAALKAPDWYGTMKVKGSMNEMALLDKRKRLEDRLKVHGQQIRDIQLELVQVRRQEEERGAGASDMSRWDAVLSALDQKSESLTDDISIQKQQETLRALLTTLFGSASRYKHQAHEAHEAVAEMREQLDLLRLKLQAAEVEKVDVLMRAEACGLHLRTTPASGGEVEKETTGNPPKDLDMQAVDILQQLDELSSQHLSNNAAVVSSQHDDNGKEGSEVVQGRAMNSQRRETEATGTVDVDYDDEVDAGDDVNAYHNADDGDDVDVNEEDAEVINAASDSLMEVSRGKGGSMTSPLDHLKRALGGGSVTNRLRRLANLGQNSVASKRWGGNGSEEALEYQVTDTGNGGQQATGIMRQRSSVSAGSGGSSRSNGKRRAWIPG
jgi:hypothetical protein